MPFLKKVHGSWLIVNGKRTTTNHKLQTINRKSSGFTLIELLVVIAISSVLAGVAFVSFINAREKSIDKKRKSDILALKQALVTAKTDDGYYKNNLTDGTLIPKYINKIPQDPILSIPYIYIPQPPNCDATSTCTSFSLITCLDNPKDKEQDDAITYANSGCTTPASYTTTSPQ
ncbi:MAG: prepilin-type N-terminal cleavage/methylation domain-containing protein [Patescibacteria group bacterium]